MYIMIQHDMNIMIQYDQYIVSVISVSWYIIMFYIIIQWTLCTKRQCDTLSSVYSLNSVICMLW